MKTIMQEPHSEVYNPGKLREIYFSEMKAVEDVKVTVKSKTYITKFFYPTNSGNTVLIENGTYSIIGKNFRETFLNKFPCKDLIGWYQHDVFPYTEICDPKKPMVFQDEGTGIKYINLSHRFKWSDVKTYDELPDKDKAGVQKMLGFIKEVWANGVNEVYEYLLNWLSVVVKGGKNESLLYVKGVEGIGKSRLVEFIRDHVLGWGLYSKGTSDDLKGKFNIHLLGRLLVHFEELQFDNERDWVNVDSKLKDWVSGTAMRYEEKGKTAFDAATFANYIINTNFTAVKNIQGRRYLVVDMNPKYKGDFKYWDDLTDTCYNDDVGYAFFCLLKQRDTSTFKSNRIPVTEAKKTVMAKHLLPIEKFLKTNFVIPAKGISIKSSELYETYAAYCINKGIKKPCNVAGMCESLREYGIHRRLRNGYGFINVPNDELQAIAKRNNWLSEFDKDEAEYEQAQADCGGFLLDHGTEMQELTSLRKQVNEQAETIKELQRQLAEAKKPKRGLREIVEEVKTTISHTKNDIDQINKMLEESNKDEGEELAIPSLVLWDGD